MDIKVRLQPDFDHEVQDVVLIVDGEECWIKGFDDVDWKEATTYGEALATSLGVPFESI